jgi:hypothetical protein
MPITIPNIFTRKYFSQAVLNGQAIDSNLFAYVDAQFADIMNAVGQQTALLRAITTPAGTLRYSIVQNSNQSASASQSLFTIATYDNVNDLVFAFTDNALPTDGLVMISPASVSLTSSTTVTIPPQPAGSNVMIQVFNVGNGTSQLASTSVNQGASLVGINDAGAFFSTKNVEFALQQLATNLGSSYYLGSILGLGAYLQANGSVALTGNLNANSNKITGLTNGTASGDSVNYQQLQSVITQVNNFTANFLKTDGTNAMSANMNMGEFAIGNMAKATAAGQAVEYTQYQLSLLTTGGTMTGALNMGGKPINYLLDPVSAQDAATKDYVDTATAGGGFGIIAGSSIDGASTAIPTTSGFYEWSSLSWTVSATAPYIIHGRVNGNAVINANVVRPYPSLTDIPWATALGLYVEAPPTGANVPGNGVYGKAGTNQIPAGSLPRAYLSYFRKGACGQACTNGTGVTPGGGSITLFINGNLTATGSTLDVSGFVGYTYGPGAGSILIVCNGTITGGTYYANGGTGGAYGGGGGRITLIATAFAGSITAVAGAGGGGGNAGIAEQITLTSSQIAQLFDR